MKIYNIKSCSNCPSLSALTNIVGTYNVCHLEMREIKDINIIQEWCELEDCDETDNK